MVKRKNKTSKEESNKIDPEMARKIETLKLKAVVREAEAKKKEEKNQNVPKDTKVTFDSWYHLRASKIPKQHMKEIIAADFKARKLSDMESIEDFDNALKQYGVKLS